MLLSIDTSSRYAGVALSRGGEVVSCRLWRSAVNHTAELMPAIAQVLAGQGATPGQLDGIAVALGPGGFSALRVGMSAAKGLALAGKKPLVGVGTLDLEAFPYLELGLPVCALVDAGRKEVASACFGADGRRTRDDLVGPPEEVLSEVAQPTLFCGEGVQPWAALLRERLGAWGLVVAHHTPAARLWALAETGRRKLEAGETSDLTTLQPYYLRLPSIGGPKRRDWTPQQS